LKKFKLFLNLKTLWNNQRIRQRILISYLVVVLLPVTFINAWTFMQSRHAVLVKVEDTLDVTLANVNSSFNTLLTGMYDRAAAISRAPELADLLIDDQYPRFNDNSPTLQLSETLSALNVIVGNSPQYYYRFYSQRDHITFNSGNLQIVSSKPHLQADWYQTAINFGDGIYWRSLYDDSGFFFPRRFITANSVIYSDTTTDRKPLGLATVSLDFSRVEDLIASFMKTYRGDVYIFDSHGKTLYARNFNSQKSLEDTAVATPMATSILSDVMSREEGSGLSGIDSIYNYITIDQLLWKVVTVLPQDQFVGVTDSLWTFLVPILLATIFVFLLVTQRVARNLSRPIEVLSESMRENNESAFPVRYLERQDEIGALTRAYARMLQRNADLVAEAREVNEKKRVFQLEALQRQIDSHFLYNSLNNIQWLAADGRNEDVISTATSLEKLLRACATQKDELVTIEDELDYVDSYLNIQKIRHGNRFTYKFEINPRLLQMRIPMFIMQPIVENAIYHGLLDSHKTESMILIRIFSEQDQIIISILDNGRGISQTKLDAIFKDADDQDRFMGIALKNIDTRLKLTFGDNSRLSISSLEGSWTDVRMRIPMVEDYRSATPARQQKEKI
jgi:two-component system sensor histidine kinase YesM